MPIGHRTNLIQFLRAVRPVTNPTDGELLGRFVARRDGAAFAELVRRHGPMVLGVCLRVLRHEQDAEDAFQAAFLVLARKAASVVPREAVGGWLHGVACRTALGARARRSRREAREKHVGDLPEQAATELHRIWDELAPLLDRELSRLPEKYRLPVVLCEMEGRPRKEVARQLGVPEGTLSSRLATARKMLAQRLSRCGVGLSVVALAAGLGHGAAQAKVPECLAVSTVEAASSFATGCVAAGAVRPGAAALTEGVMKAMLIGKIKVATAMLLAILLVAGVGALGRHALAGDGPSAGGSGGPSAPTGTSGPPPAVTGPPGPPTAPGTTTPTGGGLPPGAPDGPRTAPPAPGITPTAPSGGPGTAPTGGGFGPPGVPGDGSTPGLPGRLTDPSKGKPNPEQRLTEMERKLRQLQEKVDALEKELRSLRGDRDKPAPKARGVDGQIKVFTLQHADARATAAVLGQTFAVRDTQTRISDAGKNQIVVYADVETLVKIANVLQELDVPKK
jgi:RNA polymerase sigma factor (sigma-70 family)